jgi:hypothetical protein
MPSRDTTLGSPMAIERVIIANQRLQAALYGEDPDNTQPTGKTVSRSPDGADREKATKADNLAGYNNGAYRASAVRAHLPSPAAQASRDIHTREYVVNQSSYDRVRRLCGWHPASAGQPSLETIEVPGRTIKQKGPSLMKVMGGRNILRNMKNDTPAATSAAGNVTIRSTSDNNGSKKEESSLVRMVKKKDGVENYTRCKS